MNTHRTSRKSLRPSSTRLLSVSTQLFTILAKRTELTLFPGLLQARTSTILFTAPFRKFKTSVVSTACFETISSVKRIISIAHSPLPHALAPWIKVLARHELHWLHTSLTTSLPDPSCTAHTCNVIYSFASENEFVLPTHSTTCSTSWAVHAHGLQPWLSSRIREHTYWLFHNLWLWLQEMIT